MRQKLGQHFLKNLAVARSMARAINPSPGETILEIGPGHGELTGALVEQIEKSIEDSGQDIKLLAIEKDPELWKEVSERFKDKEFVEVIQGDALDLIDKDIEKVAGRNYKLAGNLPYYITGHLLRKISELKNKPALAVFMMQEEVAERMTAVPPRMNRLSASVQFWAKPKIILKVPRGNFNPPPEVESAVVSLERKPKPATDSGIFYAAVRLIFSQPRKTVFNNLRENHDSLFVKDIIEKVGLSEKSRPQDLSLDQIEVIARDMLEL